MSRDIRIPVIVEAELYVAAKTCAEEAGHSLSSWIRQLMRVAVTEYAKRDAEGEAASSARVAQELDK